MTVKTREQARTTRITLCRRLALERLIRGLSQDDIARHIGAQQTLISYLETGRRNPYLETVIAVAEALGLHLALVADHHLPLLDLTAAQVAALGLPAPAEPIGAPNA